MIPDHLFDEGITTSLLRNDMKHVQLNRIVFEKTQKDYEREQRNLLSSQDGDTCEIHDQFYRDHKLLLVLFRALAVMPITRSRPGEILSSYRFFNITIAVYGALSEIVDHGFGFSFKEMGLFVDTLYCSTLLFIFADCSHKSTLKVAAGVQDTLLSIDVLSVDRPTQKEVYIYFLTIDHFIQAIEMNPAVVSLKGYAHVNRELLTSAISMIAIYLIVLLQFKISLPKDSSTAN
ncbi:unnamed protein product, partial [Brenthis ino]